MNLLDFSDSIWPEWRPETEKCNNPILWNICLPDKSICTQQFLFSHVFEPPKYGYVPVFVL